MIGRREFVWGCGISLAAVALRPLPLLASTATVSEPLADARLGKATFAPLLSRWLQFSDAAYEHVASLQLVALRDGPRAANLESFSLLLRGRAGTRLPESIYRVASRFAPSFELFIKPVSGPGKGVYFAADFSLLR